MWACLMSMVPDYFTSKDAQGSSPTHHKESPIKWFLTLDDDTPPIKPVSYCTTSLVGWYGDILDVNGVLSFHVNKRETFFANPPYRCQPTIKNPRSNDFSLWTMIFRLLSQFRTVPTRWWVGMGTSLTSMVFYHFTSKNAKPFSPTHPTGD